MTNECPHCKHTETSFTSCVSGIILLIIWAVTSVYGTWFVASTLARLDVIEAHLNIKKVPAK
jgi:hypothetical protein